MKSRIRRARQRVKKYEYMIQEALDITVEKEQRSQHQLKGDIIKEIFFQYSPNPSYHTLFPP